jgi:hypothetical protein
MEVLPGGEGIDTGRFCLNAKENYNELRDVKTDLDHTAKQLNKIKVYLL